MGADTKANALGAAAHFRLVIFVSLRMAASAVMPLFPIPFLLRLRARGKMETVREKACQWALTRKRTLWGGGALEIDDIRLVENGSQRGGALGSDAVVCEPVSEG